MKREYSRQIPCTHEGCKEVGYYTFTSQRDYYAHCEKQKTWTCVRHSNIKDVLSEQNTTTEATLICKTLYTKDGSVLGNFWQEEKDFGTDKCNSGFQYGNGYKAFASDFPEGTKVIVIARLELPNH